MMLLRIDVDRPVYVGKLYESGLSCRSVRGSIESITWLMCLLVIEVVGLREVARCRVW
jgi:hypothetical protein